MPFWLDILHEIRNDHEDLRRYAVLAEGVDDPGVLKCVFMAGGPGSGKSYVAGNLFAITPRFHASFSTYGLKLVNSDTAFETALKQNGINPKDLATLAARADEWKRLMALRDRAKSLTQTQQRYYESGRLGLIIDGTGDDYDKIHTKVQHAQALGYDCYMIFVNTTLEVAQARNAARPRSLPEQLVKDIWTDVQKNAGKFQHLFGVSQFVIVDNSDNSQTLHTVDKQIRQWMRAPIQNPIGKQWLTLAHRHRP
jgi:predicted kinase